MLDLLRSGSILVLIMHEVNFGILWRIEACVGPDVVFVFAY